MRRVSTKQHPLEFRVYKSVLASAPAVAIRRVAAAVSGGRDSIAMLHVLSAIQKRLGFFLVVVYVHHGKSKSALQSKFRDSAARKVESAADKLGLPFAVLRAKPSGESEERLREARLTEIGRFAAENAIDHIALGHHSDDLFETRLIRLIRGTGPQGLQSMRIVSREVYGVAKLWRPLLEVSRSDIQTYLDSLKLVKSRDWLDDPSNRDARYLRNSIRKTLVPAIEAVRSGGVAAMARSLELISESLDLATDDGPRGEAAKPLSRAELLSLTPGRRRVRLAGWLRANELRGISRAQIIEILKRIDTPRKNLTFTLGGRVWRVDRFVRCHAETESSIDSEDATES